MRKGLTPGRKLCSECLLLFPSHGPIKQPQQTRVHYKEKDSVQDVNHEVLSIESDRRVSLSDLS